MSSLPLRLIDDEDESLWNNITPVLPPTPSNPAIPFACGVLLMLAAVIPLATGFAGLSAHAFRPSDQRVSDLVDASNMWFGTNLTIESYRTQDDQMRGQGIYLLQAAFGTSSGLLMFVGGGGLFKQRGIGAGRAFSGVLIWLISLPIMNWAASEITFDQNALPTTSDPWLETMLLTFCSISMLVLAITPIILPSSRLALGLTTYDEGE